ncbi:MAG TPA: tyrosine-type recombinase/integrase [Galbitalea sp.]|jgi:integrase|nr:tyrosine-type recombinase/integrase [Galbitalea sp.]
MGSVTPYQTVAGKRYRVRYRKPDTSQTDKRGFRTKREAELFLASGEVSKSRGAYLDPTKARITVGEWMALWISSRNDLRATTRTRVIGIIDTHINPKLGSVAIGDLNRLRVQQWASSIPGAPQTVRKTVNVLSGALQLAIEDGRLSANPAARLKLPKTIKTSKRYLSHDQVAALAKKVNELPNGKANGYGLLILVLAYCGLRWGELSGLRVGDVDLARGRIIVRQTVVMDKGHQRIEAPKDYEHRSIPIPAFMIEPLRTQIAGRAETAPVFFGIHTKTWLRNASFRKSWFDPAATSVGLEGITPHEMRHTAASLAVSAGANVKAVQKMLGHASAVITLDTYADLFDQDLDTVAVALDREAMRSKIRDLWP